MTDERIRFVCEKAAELRKGKTVDEMSQSEAMKIANKEYNDTKKLTD